ncbi:MAG TPA: universal stress protein [Dyella sp.]|uniref:universal stress protein n=1 Tax=Dyella sp. TaxID=1869338 RepID=UPI002D05FA26|nr:universal stress protein [Dyella sp.]HTV84632.1 universal stress protein [Dyella sp.]
MNTVAIHESSIVPRRVQFRHLLLPIDGSELSLKAFGKGLELAKAFGAKVLILHAVPPFNSVAFVSEILAAAELNFSQHALASASRYLDEAKALAVEAGVPCECHYAFGEQPHNAILEAAREHRCDLIVMATHGWRGMDRLMLGSEAQKVILDSTIPVLVCR